MNCIEKMLREYRSIKSKLRLKEREERIELQKLNNVNDINCISAAPLNDMPKAQNKFNSVVENIVLQLEQAELDREPIYKKLIDISKEKFDLQSDVDRVDALLIRLTIEEKFVIDCYYIGGLSMGHIVEEYKKRFNQFRSYRHLYRVKEISLKKLEM